MTKPETALSAVVERTFPLSEFGDDLHDYLQRGLRDVLYADLTALISEWYVEKAAYIALENTLARTEANGLELLRQRDELKEALEEQKRLYFNLFNEEVGCMYCEAKLKRGSAIILCKECAESTEV